MHRHLSALARLTALLCVALAVVAPDTSATAARDRSAYVVARPSSIDFGMKSVGGEYFQRTRITNVSGQPIRLLVSAGLPDDFGFGLMPGSTCPVLDGGDVLAPHDSCYAVVRFAPTEGFLGWPAQGEMWADAFDPGTGTQLAHLLVPVTGMAVR